MKGALIFSVLPRRLRHSFDSRLLSH